MAPTKQSTRLQNMLLAPASRPFEKAIGWAAVISAAFLLAFSLFMVAAIVRGNAHLVGLLSALAASSLVTYFFASIGYRLVLARPTRTGSIASATTWFVCFACFCTLTLLLVVVAIIKRDFGPAQGAALSAMLALLAYGAASHFRRRK